MDNSSSAAAQIGHDLAGEPAPDLVAERAETGRFLRTGGRRHMGRLENSGASAANLPLSAVPSRGVHPRAGLSAGARDVVQLARA